MAPRVLRLRGVGAVFCFSATGRRYNLAHTAFRRMLKKPSSALGQKLVKEVSPSADGRNNVVPTCRDQADLTHPDPLSPLPCGPQPSGLRPPKGFSPQAGGGPRGRGVPRRRGTG